MFLKVRLLANGRVQALAVGAALIGCMPPTLTNHVSRDHTWM